MYVCVLIDNTATRSDEGAQEEQRSKAAPWAEMVGAQHPNTNPKPNYYEAGAKAANEVAVGSAEHSTDSAAQEVNASLTDHAKVAKKGDGSKKSVRERYRFIREQYPEVMKRLDRHRTEMAGVLEWRGSPKNVLLATANANFNNNPLKSGQHKSSTPKESESTVTVFKHPDISAIDDRPSSKMSHSYTLPENIDSDRNSIREVDFYGDDFVNTRRRSRYARTRERAPSRGAKSDMGEVGQYGGLKPYMKDSFYAYDTVPAYSSSSYAFNYYPSGRHSLGPVQGGYSQDQYGPYATVDSSMRRRPQSSFDARAYSRREQANSHYGVYDAYYGQRMNEREREGDTSETDEGSIESDDEMAQIHHQQQMMRRSAAMYMGAGGVATDPEERYYLGVIQLPQERARQLLYRYPPPADYFHLPAIERVAYLFYCALYRRHFQPVDVFHKRFNREYYNYTCDGDSSEIALWKIRINKRICVFFRVSDRGSRCEHEEDSDRLSVDSALREPLKFRSPHSFVRFGVGGKVLVVDPGLSVSVVEVRDLKALVRDTEIRRVVEAAESFKGPLVADFTPTHSVRLYVQRQIERILKSDAYRANPSSGYANDALLVWQLLEMVVQQQGRVTGPDLSRLLMAGSHSSGRRSQGREKNSPSLSPQPNERIADPRAYERFTHFLLGGHIDEAIDSALKDGLYADALVLARRVCAHDPRKLDKVEAAFLAHRADQNPVMTLLSVASDMPAPILVRFRTNPPTEDSSSWRSHAAVVLANLSSPTAFNTVYHLGRVLARREYHAAADFCFLAVNLLAGYDPFQPVITSSEEDGSVRQHITLIHASVPHDETDSTLCRCRFSLADLHATEIFEYAVRLASSAMPTALSRSLEYQMCKLDYAEMISECGGFSTDAFRYCIEVARAVWDRCAELSNDQLTRLCDLADRLQFVAGADASEVAWIPIMRSVVDKRGVQESVMQPDQQQQPQQTKSAISAAQQIVAQQEISQQNQIAAANYTQSSKDVVATTAGSRDKERTVSLSSEAADWHADHQEPLQMAHVEEPISELPSTQQQRAVESKQQAPAAVGRSGSEHRQHHLLRQRRPSGNAANATANVRASYAFPPSMPGAGELPTLHQQMPGSRSASISECALQAPSTGETAQQISKQQNAQGYAIDEGRDSYAKNAAAAAATGSQPRATFWQGDTPDGDAPLSSVEPSTGTTTSTEESTTTASNSADGSPCRQSSERQHSSTTVVTNMSSYSTINDSVFTAGVADSFRIPSDDAAKSAAAPPKPHLASYEEPPPSASMPVMPTPASDHTMVEQQPKAIAKSTESAKHAPSSKGAQHGGILSMLKAKIAKAIPTGHEMILPDDTNPSIVWDPVLNKYVGAGVEEEIVSTPPPSAANSGVFDGSGNGSTGGLRAARVSGGSRYFNPLNDANSSSAQTISKSPVPMVTMPIPTTTFGFIPSMPDDDDGAPADSPFSVNTAPAEPAVASAAAQ
ncbi:unnamed protein product [Toxocara canis]|uniref:Protein transport protein sec16 n=1 Tax=Toxocara canis TaxID=6265 RepID=A0A183UBY9_TOXCA|nr:unnamed protein product [Toxocara canis]